MTSRSFPGPAVFDQPEGQFPTYTDNPEGKAPILIPGLDLLNHFPSSRVAWLWDSTACTIKNDEPLSGGGEVPNNYGPKSNEECEIDGCSAVNHTTYIDPEFSDHGLWVQSAG